MNLDRKAVTEDDKHVVLTDDELKVVRALKRLEKMNFGRIRLFENGSLSIRFNGRDGDDLFRAYDISTGKLLWEVELEAGAKNV